VLLSVAFIGLALASWFDLRTREIPDYVNYSLLLLGLVLRLAWWLLHENFIDGFFLFISAILAGVIVFVITYVMYLLGQWGGGDTKLMLACAALLSSFPQRTSFLLSFVMNLVIFMVAYPIVYLGVIGLKNRKKLLKKNGARVLAFLVSCCASVLILLVSLRYALISALLFLMGLTPLLIRVEKSFLHKKVKPSELTEGDWLVKPVRVGEEIIKCRGVGLTKSDLKKLKKHKARVWIKLGVPLAPAFLLAFITTLLLKEALILKIIKVVMMN